MVAVAGVEPTTTRVSDECSYQIELHRINIATTRVPPVCWYPAYRLASMRENNPCKPLYLICLSLVRRYKCRSFSCRVGGFSSTYWSANTVPLFELSKRLELLTSCLQGKPSTIEITQHGRKDRSRTCNHRGHNPGFYR